MKKITILTLALWSIMLCFAQSESNFTHVLPLPLIEKPIRCGSYEYEQMLRKQFPNLESRENFELWLAKEVKKQEAAGKTRNVISIPTIVHVVNNGESIGSGTNISQAQVNSQFTVLNQDFGRTNPDTANTPAVFQSVAANTEIQFCPALIDTNGIALAEPGIDRIDRNTEGWTVPPFSDSYIDATIKPSSIWNPDQYFNIWVLDIGTGLLGYAQFPIASGLPGIPTSGVIANTDGVVMSYLAFGTMGSVMPPYNLGRSTVHEVGHWLGLRHIWGDVSGCTGTDYCADTPNQSDSHFGCSTFPSISCTNGPNGDMFMNYMDYSDDACVNLFTLDQKARMQTVMAVSPRRASLVSSTACTSPNSPPVANFIPSATTTCTGSSVNFTFTGTAGAGATYSWLCQSGSSFISTTPNTVITFPNPGVYAVSLVVSNMQGSDTLVLVNAITVLNCTSIQGNILAAPASVDTFTVYLVQYDSTAGTLTAIDSLSNVSNYYQFVNVPSGDYLVKAAVNQGSPSYSNYLPTYFSSSLFWSSATYVSVPNLSQASDIQLLAGTNPGGPGFIGGFVSQGANKTTNTGDPIKDVAIILLDMNDNPIAYTYSDVNGLFEFPSLTYGTYKVWAEIWGKVTTPEIVTISPNQTTVTGISVEINSTYISSYIDENQSFSDLKVYPNPTNNEIHIKMDAIKKTQCTFEIMDVCGKKLFNQTYSLNVGKQDLSIQLKDLPSGIFYLKMTDEAKAIKMCKIVKQ